MYGKAQNKRGYEKYQEQRLANCFEHAVYNLSNEELSEFDDFEKMIFRLFPPGKEGVKKAFEFIGDSGLIIEPCKRKAILKSNEWRVAFYIRKETKKLPDDWHWILQMPDGQWTEKAGVAELKQRKNTPLFLLGNRGVYRRIGYYKITNSYANSNIQTDSTRENQSNSGDEVE